MKHLLLSLPLLAAVGCFASGEDIEACRRCSEKFDLPIYSVSGFGDCNLTGATIYDPVKSCPVEPEPGEGAGR